MSPTEKGRATGSGWLAWGAVNAAAAVALAAAAAHASALQAASFVPSAIAMHQMHALGLVLVGVLLRQGGPARWWHASASLFTLGLLLFCYNLYARALLDFSAPHRAVPLGGMCFIAGWVVLAVGAWNRKTEGPANARP